LYDARSCNYYFSWPLFFVQYARYQKLAGNVSGCCCASDYSFKSCAMLAAPLVANSLAGNGDAR